MPACVTLCGDASLLSLSLFVALRCSAKKSRESISRQNKATSSAATTTRCQTASIITALHAVTAKKEYYVHTYIHTFIQMRTNVCTYSKRALSHEQPSTDSQTLHALALAAAALQSGSSNPIHLLLRLYSLSALSHSLSLLHILFLLAVH